MKNTYVNLPGNFLKKQIEAQEKIQKNVPKQSRTNCWKISFCNAQNYLEYLEDHKKNDLLKK